MNTEKKEIVVIDGYCYECIGIRMIPSFVVDLNDNLIAGRRWMEDIISTKKSIPLQKIVKADFTEYRKDATEKWQPHPLKGKH
jgi:hypothetical protein